MKRIVSLIMAVALMAVLCVGANAAPTILTDTQKTGTGNVYVKVSNAAKKYHVVVTWDDLTFTYSKGIWDPSTLKYGEGSWSGEGTVSVENRSNAAITYSATYAADANAEVKGVSVGFKVGEAAPADTIENAALISAVGSTTNGPSSSFEVVPSGDLGDAVNNITEAKKIGTVTVTINTGA